MGTLELQTINPENLQILKILVLTLAGHGAPVLQWFMKCMHKALRTLSHQANDIHFPQTDRCPAHLSGGDQ